METNRRSSPRYRDHRYDPISSHQPGHQRREQPSGHHEGLQESPSYNRHVLSWLAKQREPSDPINRDLSRTDERRGETYSSRVARPAQSEMIGDQAHQRSADPTARMHGALGSDSSLLEPAFHVATDKRDRNQERQRKRSRGATSPDHHYNESITRQSRPVETFERRKRHKTREDRYDPKTPKTRGLDHSKPREVHRREKRGDQRRAAQKAGYALMRDFSSSKIGDDRLTVKPAHGPGLFKNGRASSPFRKRALPDLAFSEMSFLRRSANKPNYEQTDRTVSKSTKKDRERFKRAHHDIDSYFKNCEERPRDANPHHRDREQARSTLSPEELSRYTSSRSALPLSNQIHADHPKPFLGFGSRGGPSPAGTSIVPSRLEDFPKSDLSSKRPASDYTWSESGQTAVRRDCRANLRERSILSSTPLSIRRQLHQTGVLDGVDAERGQRFHRHGSLHSNERGIHNDQISRSDPQVRREAMVSSSAVDEQTPNRGQRSLAAIPINPHETEAARLERTNPRADVKEPNHNPESRPSKGSAPQRTDGPVVENFDPGRGWTKNSVQHAPMNDIGVPARIIEASNSKKETEQSPTQNDSQLDQNRSIPVPTRTPVSRQAIAQNIYIRKISKSSDSVKGDQEPKLETLVLHQDAKSKNSGSGNTRNSTASPNNPPGNLSRPNLQQSAYKTSEALQSKITETIDERELDIHQARHQSLDLSDEITATTFPFMMPQDIANPSEIMQDFSEAHGFQRLETEQSVTDPNILNFPRTNSTESRTLYNQSVNSYRIPTRGITPYTDPYSTNLATFRDPIKHITPRSQQYTANRIAGPFGDPLHDPYDGSKWPQNDHSVFYQEIPDRRVRESWPSGANYDTDEVEHARHHIGDMNHGVQYVSTDHRSERNALGSIRENYYDVTPTMAYDYGVESLPYGPDVSQQHDSSHLLPSARNRLAISRPRSPLKPIGTILYSGFWKPYKQY